MKRFYKKNKLNRLTLIISLIIILDLILFHYINKSLNQNITFLAESKTEEITRYYLNQTIKKYLNINTNDYIKTNLVNNNIVSVDINNTYANKLLNSFLNDLETYMKKLENGKINNYNNQEFIYGNNGIIILIPFGVTFNTSLLSGFGPKIPVKVSFIESLEVYIDVEIENYGINNSLIKLYLNANIKERIDIPINKNKQDIKYKFLLSSKLINGKVPSIYGDTLSKNSSIVNNNVN